MGILLSAMALPCANAAVISMNAIGGTNPSLDTPFVSGQIVDPSVTASGINRGSGITASSAADRYSARNWTTTGTIDVNDYFTFILDANPGYEIDFTNFTYTGTASSSGPTAFAFRSSLDGFTANIGAPTASGTTISLSGSQYQHLTNPVEFRLYGYSSTSGTGTFSVNDYSFNGSVAAIPEPNTMALIGAGSLLMLGNRRRRSNRVTETA